MFSIYPDDAASSDDDDLKKRKKYTQKTENMQI